MSSTAVATLSPSEPPTPDVPPRAAPAAAPPLFVADVEAEDALGRASSARLLADLANHPLAGTPFLIAVHGSSGSGKSSFLNQVVERIRAPRPSGETGLTARIDASSGADPAPALVSGLYVALQTNYADLAEDAIHAGSDPLQTARAANDRVAELRRRLDAERQALDELAGRQSHLIDTILFNTPGSRVDGYARANRSRIEGRLRAFGLPTADPMMTYKDLVREAAEGGDGSVRVGTALRALWAFKGQSTLIVVAVLLLLAGWGCGFLADNQDLWVNWLTGLGDKFAGLSAWAQDHAGWLPPLSHGLYALAALAVLVNILRAFRFIQPVMRGASLLNGDLDPRRRDIDGLLAHQTRQVDQLAGEVEGAVRHAAAAERRLESRRAGGGLLETSVPPATTGAVPPSSLASAEAFLDCLHARMKEGAPRRIVVAIDDLDVLPPKAAAAYLDTVHRLLRRPGFVTIVAADRAHLLEGFSETDPAYASARLGRCVQLSFDLDAEAAAATSFGARPDTEGALDKPWQDYESALLRALMGFAGPNPRAMKRFANLYRVARADPRMAGATPPEHAGLALALALDESGAAAELGAYEEGIGRDLAGRSQGSALDEVVAAAQGALSQRFTPSDARRGLRVARIYGRRG